MQSRFGGAWQAAITATVPKILSLTLVALGFIAFKSHSLSTRLGARSPPSLVESSDWGCPPAVSDASDWGGCPLPPKVGKDVC